MIIDCISDLHGHYPELEGGDLLIVGGDWTASDTFEENGEFLIWAISRAQKQYKKVVLIAGNHDNLIYKAYKNGNETYQYLSLSYLCDSGTELTYHNERFPEEDEGFLPSGKRTFKIWGSPWTKTFEGMNPHCKAFTVDTEAELEEKWKLIPDDVDILITHSPEFGSLDAIPNMYDGTLFHAGSKSLRDTYKRIKPKLHVFGHIHEGYGSAAADFDLNTIFVNASHVNEHYKPVNKPIRIVL